MEAALLLILALLVFFSPAVFGGRVLLPADLIFDIDPLWQPLAPEGYSGPANPILSDQVYQFYPWKAFALRSLAQGRLPLWNPYIAGGLPFVGNGQSAVFSPFNLLGYLLPLNSSYVVTAILRLFVAGLLTFLFAREIGLGLPGALLAMVTFAFSGPMIVWLGHPHSLVIVWLPAMLLTVEKILTRRKLSYIITGSLVVAAQFLGGHPGTSFHVMLTWAAYALGRAISIAGWHPSRLLPQFASAAMAAATGTLLAAVQLLPFGQALFYSATLSTRAAEASRQASSFFSRLIFEWHDWPTAITALLPRYFGTDLDGSYWFPYSNCVEQCAYVGVLPLALAAMITLHSFRHRSYPRRGPALFFALVAVVCLGVALRLPVLNAVNYLPVFNLVANGRMRLIYAFAVAVLAGLGLDEIVREPRLCWCTTLRILALFTLISLLLIALAYAGLVIFKDEIIQYGRDFMEANWGTPSFSRPLEYYYALVEWRYEKKLALFRPSNPVMFLPVLVVLLWFVLHRWSEGQSHRTGKAVWTCVALGLTTLDAFVVGMLFNPTMAPQHVFPTPGAIQYLRRDGGIFRVAATDLILHPNAGMLFGISDIRGYDTVVSQRYTHLMDRLEGHYRFHFHSLFVQTDSPLFDLLNVKYVLTDRELDGKWELTYEDAGSVKIYRNTDVLPRAFVVYRAEIVDGASQSLERVTDSAFDSRTRVVLEEMPADWTEPLDVSAAAVQIADYQANRVRLEVDTVAAGLLVLTDTHGPGWKALLDGYSIPVYVADHAFRAVVVPAGRHQVEFVYEPLGFRIGATVSLLTGVALILVASIARFRRARDPSR